MKIKFRNVSVFLTIILLIATMSACAKSNKSKESSELNEEQIESLMEQVAKDKSNGIGSYYEDGKYFAYAEIFGIDRDGNIGIAYVYLNCSEYVAHKNKVYNIAGTMGPAIIRFTYTDNEPLLNEVEWGADGSEHLKWIKENFPKKYFRKYKAYDEWDKNGRNMSANQIDKKVEKEMGLPVETENNLIIDPQEGTYKIYNMVKKEADNPNKPPRYNSITIEKGSLDDL